MFPAHRADLPYILHRNRLTAAGVVRNRQHHERHARVPHIADQRVERVNIHVPLKWVA
jgi:hypothetical protein